MFNKENIQINCFKYLNNLFSIETIVYYTKDNTSNEFYYDFSTLEYTKNGIINYCNFNYKNIKINQEIALSSFGLNYSFKFNYKFKRFDFYLIRKTLNEKIILGLIFNSRNFKIDIEDKIYPLSIYGGQGIKRDFTIDSKLNFNYELFKLDQNLSINIFHQISYNEYLIREVIQNFEIINLIKIQNNLVKFRLQYKNKCFNYFVKLNDIEISYKNESINLEIKKKIKKNDNEFIININSNSIFKISYNINL